MVRDDYGDIPLRGYQDDLDVGDEQSDPMMDERQDDPIKFFKVPPEEFRKELDDLAIDEDVLHQDDAGFEDARERIEDLDEDPDEKS